MNWRNRVLWIRLIFRPYDLVFRWLDCVQEVCSWNRPILTEICEHDNLEHDSIAVSDLAPSWNVSLFLCFQWKANLTVQGSKENIVFSYKRKYILCLKLEEIRYICGLFLNFFSIFLFFPLNKTMTYFFCFGFLHIR